MSTKMHDQKILQQEDRRTQRTQQTLFDAPLFCRAQAQAELYRTLAWGAGFEVITTQGQVPPGKKFRQRFSLLVSSDKLPAIPLSALSYSLSGSLLILLKRWLENSMPGSPETMDSIFQQLIMPGVRSALGVK